MTFELLGIILGIMPWNFPFWQVFKFAIPTICEGNVCVLKHASNVPRSVLEVEKVFLEAEFPENVFSTLLIDSKTAMEIIKKEIVDGVSLTCSVNAGSEIGEFAGRAIKPFVLELGGSDPFIVLEDVDIERAAQAAAKSRFLSTEWIKSGFVAINGIVSSDPRLPFGGVKKSGIGRKLSHYGLKEFVNIKAIVI